MYLVKTGKLSDIKKLGEDTPQEALETRFLLVCVSKHTENELI